MGLLASFIWIIVGIIYILYKFLKEDSDGCLGGSIAILLALSPFILMLVGGTMYMDNDSDSGETLFWTGVILGTIEVIVFSIMAIVDYLPKRKRKNRNREFISRLRSTYKFPYSFEDKIETYSKLTDIYIECVENYGTLEQKMVLKRINRDRWFNSHFGEFVRRDAGKLSDSEWKLIALDAYGVSDFPENSHSDLYKYIREKTINMGKKVAEALNLNEKNFVDPWYFCRYSNRGFNQNEIFIGIMTYFDYSDEIQYHPAWKRYTQLMDIYNASSDDIIKKYRGKLLELIEKYCRLLGLAYNKKYFDGTHQLVLEEIAKFFALCIVAKENLINVSDEQIKSQYWSKLFEVCDPNRPHNLICKHRFPIDH